MKTARAHYDGRAMSDQPDHAPQPGTLYVVATPIGNLGDLSPRAQETLRGVSAICAEDTRHTRRLLAHFGIEARLVALHEHNEASRVDRVRGWLDAGETLALVSDAGTPLVSDPGARLVQAVAAAGHRVVPLPGASAVLAALVASGLSTERFAFLGFMPRKGGEREATLARVARSAETTVVFESPERLGALLADLARDCGTERGAAVARELTKLHESIQRGTLGELHAYYQEHPPRGEVTVVIAPAPPVTDDDLLGGARRMARDLLHEGTAPSQVARAVAQRTGLSRNRAYQLVQQLQDDGSG